MQDDEISKVRSDATSAVLAINSGESDKELEERSRHARNLINKWRDALELKRLALRMTKKNDTAQWDALQSEFDVLEQQAGILRKAVLLQGTKQESEKYYRLMNLSDNDSIIRMNLDKMKTRTPDCLSNDVTMGLQRVNRLLEQSVKQSSHVLNTLATSSEQLKMSSSANSDVSEHLKTSAGLINKFSSKQSRENVQLAIAIFLFIITVLYILKTRLF